MSDDEVNAILAIGVDVTMYLAVVTLWSASVIKVSDHTHSNTFRRLNARLQLHSNNFGFKQLCTTVKKFY